MSWSANPMDQVSVQDSQGVARRRVLHCSVSQAVSSDLKQTGSCFMVSGMDYFKYTFAGETLLGPG